MPSMDRMIRKGWKGQRVLYYLQWRDARKYPEAIEYRSGCPNEECLTDGDRSWLMRDKPFGGWTDMRLRRYWMDRIMLLEFGEGVWWRTERVQREAYIKAQRHWVNIKEDDLNRD